jgi:ribokinase
MMNKLVVLGSVNADHVLQVPSFPRPGETLSGKNYALIGGGKGANQAVAAVRLGADVDFIACIGDDSFGSDIRNKFIVDGINVDAVMVEKNTPTGIAMIQVSESGENSICISAEANACLTVERLQPHLPKIIVAEMLLMQLETPLETILAAAKFAKKSITQVVLNPAPAQTLTDELLALVDIITPNETEAQLLTGVNICDDVSAQQAADALHNKGIKLVLITLGKRGVWLSENKKGKLINGFSVNAIDTTAAGDTFNGALLAALLADQCLQKAIIFAQAAAAITVTGIGAQSSIPYKDQVEVFLAEACV